MRLGKYTTPCLHHLIVKEVMRQKEKEEGSFLLSTFLKLIDTGLAKILPDIELQCACV